MNAAPGKRESRSVLALRALVGHPAGLRLAQIAELAGVDMTGPSRHRNVSNYAATLNSLERRGYVRRDGPRQGTAWFITTAGSAALAGDSFRSAPGGFTHGTNYGYHKAKCRCDECRAWFRAYFQKWYPGSDMQKRATEYSRQWRAANPERNKERDDRGKARAKQRNRELRDTATRHMQPWTATDLEMASRRDLTAAEIAVILGRTERSIATMRDRLRDGNPRDRMLRDGPTPPTSRSGPR